MFDTIDRLVEAGYFERVYLAGRYAAFRATAIRYGCDNLRFGLNVNHAANELYLLIDELDADADELDAVSAYIEAEFADDFDDDDEVYIDGPLAA